ncbi:MAG TPA: hypothetical protein VF174_09780 [Micromonosporaceae bacterium]
MSSAVGADVLLTRRSSRFVAWVRAWRAGLVPFDEVADQIAGDEEHLVADAPGTWTDVPLREALPILSKVAPNDIRLVLPAPGDPRGLPGPGVFTDSALLAGEAVVAARLGFIPEVRRHTSGSGMTFETVHWRTYSLPPSAKRQTPPSPAEAEAELAATLAEATAELTRIGAAQWRPELSGALATLRRPDAGADLPPGFDPRARRLFARASMLDRVLALAEQVVPGGAVTGHEARRRDEVLRPLTTACRRALMAACNAPLAP